MKSLMADMIVRKNSKIKAGAEQNKKLVAKNRNEQKQEQIKEVIAENKIVMKEPKTLMID